MKKTTLRWTAAGAATLAAVVWIAELSSGGGRAPSGAVSLSAGLMEPPADGTWEPVELPGAAPPASDDELADALESSTAWIERLRGSAPSVELGELLGALEPGAPEALPGDALTAGAASSRDALELLAASSVLRGVVCDGDDSRALFGERVVRLGDVLAGGARVETIARRSIELALGGHTRTVSLAAFDAWGEGTPAGARGAATPAPALPPIAERTVSVELRGAPFVQALYLLLESAELNLYLAGAPAVALDVSFPRVALRDAVAVLLERNGVALVEGRAGVLALEPLVARADVAADGAQQPAAEPPGPGTEPAAEPSGGRRAGTRRALRAGGGVRPFHLLTFGLGGVGEVDGTDASAEPAGDAEDAEDGQ